jgi:hypothetical protein
MEEWMKMSNSKKIVTSIAMALMCYSVTVKAIEDIVVHTMPQPDIIPYDFVIDAGISASRYIKNSTNRNLFIDEYASALKEIIFYKMKISDFNEDKHECKKSKDENYKALKCSRAAAAKAVFEKKIPLNIENFGFVKKSFIGRIKKTYDGHGVFLVLETTDGDRWECILGENLVFDENTLYEFEGFLGLEGAYGTRGDILKREFLVTRLVKYTNQ